MDNLFCHSLETVTVGMTGFPDTVSLRYSKHLRVASEIVVEALPTGWIVAKRELPALSGTSRPHYRHHSCDICNITFTSVEQLELHLEASHNATRFFCAPCNLYLPNQDQYWVHRRKNHDPSNPYRCTTCGKMCDRQRSFDEHVAAHRDIMMCSKHLTARLRQQLCHCIPQH